MALQLVDTLIQTIDGSSDDDQKYTDLTQNMLWLNMPSDKSSIKTQPNQLSFECDIETDFWITPDLNRHSGHFYFMQGVKGDFTACVEIEANYETIYDHCGLMVI